MKNQYYGDINDFIKYAMLRHLAGGGQYKLGINWYLTKNDGSTDGNKVKYLEQPKKWREYDSELFDNLRESVINQGKRNVSRASTDLGIDNTLFYETITPDARNPRDSWLNVSVEALNACELVFLDPDNGLSVKSVPYGRKKSSKFVYDHELKSMWKSGQSKSLVIYQHLRRVNREVFMDNCCERISGLLRCSRIIRLKTSHVVFFVIPFDNHLQTILNLCEGFSNKWTGIVEQSVWGNIINLSENNNSNGSANQ